jgi:hypothetical protein
VKRKHEVTEVGWFAGVNEEGRNNGRQGKAGPLGIVRSSLSLSVSMSLI